MPARRSFCFVLTVLGCLAVLPYLTGCPGGLPGTPGTNTGGDTSQLFNTPPNVVLTADIQRGIVPLTVNFTSAGSTDDGLIVSRQWDFGDGSTSQAISPSHTYRTTGEFTVRLTLTDEDGASASRTLRIRVTQGPVAVIQVDRTSAPSAPALFNFDATGSSDPDGEIVAYEWDFDDGSREVVPVVTHTFAQAGTFRVELTVTDNTGVTNTTSQVITVGIREPEIAFTSPPQDITNIVVSPASPLWVSVEYEVEPGVARFIRAGLDRDLDACDAQVALYTVEGGALEQRLFGHTAALADVAYAPAGSQILTAAGDETARLYVLAERPTEGSQVVAADSRVTAVAFSPDGLRYAFGTLNGVTEVREVASNTVIWTATPHAGAVTDLAYSPDGTRVASAGADDRAIVHNASTGATIRVLGGTVSHGADVSAVVFSPTNSDHVLTASLDGMAKLWRVADGTVLSTFTGGHADAINTAAFSPDGTMILTGGDDTNAVLWSLFGTANSILATFTDHDGPVTAAAFSPDGTQAVTGSADGSAIFWNLEDETLIRRLRPCSSTIAALAFSPDGTRLAVAIAAENDIQLDTEPPGGQDLNLTVPAALDLSVLGEADYPAQYFLWAEIDTDRTVAVRTYSSTRVNVVAPFTSTVTGNTPRVPLINDQASIVARPSPERQIFDLGTLQTGDRIHLSLLDVPGYSQTYEGDAFSVMLLDAAEELVAWYKDDLTIVAPETTVVIGHNSPHYYLVTEGCLPQRCGEQILASSVHVRIERNVGLQPRQQIVFLDWRGGVNLYFADEDPVTIPPFNAANLNTNWGANETQLIKDAVEGRVEEVYRDYNVVVVTSDDPGTPPAGPHQTIYFGGMIEDLLQVADYIDVRNSTLSGNALVLTGTVAQNYPGLSPEEMGVAIGNLAARNVGYLIGLWDTTGADDIMGVPPPVLDPGAGLRVAPLNPANQLWQPAIGIQNAPQILLETVGPQP